MMVLLWKCSVRRFSALLLASGCCLFAQDSPIDAAGGGGSAPADLIQPAPSPPPATSDDEADSRVFGILPNYGTVDQNGNYQPLTPKQKLTIATKDTIDYPLFFLGAGLAGLSQLTDQHTSLGEGVKGYALRYGTSYSDQAVENMMTEGFLPILFREDPRYFRQGPSRGGVWWRMGYAASRILVTKTDRGTNTFNLSEVLGDGMSAGVGNAYYTNERTLGDNLQRYSVSLATDAFSNVLREFWPDIRQKYFSHRRKAQ